MTATDPRPPVSQLLLSVRDPHGRPVAGARVQLAGGGQLATGVEAAPGSYGVPLPVPGDYQLRVGRFGHADGMDHRTLRQTLFLTWHGDRLELRALRPRNGDGSRIATIAPLADDGTSFRVDIVLDYLWFTPIGTPPERGNEVRLLVDGEAGWGEVADAVEQAERSVHLTTWWYQPTTELRRPDPLLPKTERRQHTVHHLLSGRAAAGVTVRLLLWDVPVLPMQGDARKAARTDHDNFEVMQEANETETRLLDDGQHPEEPGGVPPRPRRGEPPRGVVGPEATKERRANCDEGWRGEPGGVPPWKTLLSAALGAWHIGSFHQKTVIVDDSLGFCGGMNLRENDWDRRKHAPFDAHRVSFGRPAAFRRRVRKALQLPDHRPRHDYIARLRGPAVAHLQHNFQERWNHLLATDARYSDKATPVPDPRPPPAAGPAAVQVVRTMPAPYGPEGASERGILDVYLRAIAAARRLIYIEDQYFRSTHVSDAIADAVRAWPDLQVIVVTQASYADDALAGGWTQECFERIRARRPGFELHTLRVLDRPASGSASLDEIDNHAKLMIVDDIFLTVGSANINDRGFEYEGEINLAVVDRDLVAATRLDIWREHLTDDARLSGDLDHDIAVWREHAEANRRFDLDADDSPRSHVFPFVPQVERQVWLGHDVM